VRDHFSVLHRAPFGPPSHARQRSCRSGGSRRWITTESEALHPMVPSACTDSQQRLAPASEAPVSTMGRVGPTAASASTTPTARAVASMVVAALCSRLAAACTIDVHGTVARAIATARPILAASAEPRGRIRRKIFARSPETASRIQTAAPPATVRSVANGSVRLQPTWASSAVHQKMSAPATPIAMPAAARSMLRFTTGLVHAQRFARMHDPLANLG